MLMGFARVWAAVALAAGLGWLFEKYFESDKVGAAVTIVVLAVALMFVFMTPEMNGG